MALRRVHVSGGNKRREKDLIRYSNGSITGSHCRSKHKTQYKCGLGNSCMGIVWYLCWIICFSNTGVMGIPEFFVKGYGCGKVSAKAHDWKRAMKVGESSLAGKISVQSQSLVFECPESFGILVSTNNTFNDKSGWQQLCKSTISRIKYNHAKLYLDRSELPAEVGYMCLKHNIETWFEGTFQIDAEMRAEFQKSVKLDSSTYSNSVWYRTMKWSAAGIVVGVLIVVAASAAPDSSPYKKLGIWAHSVLMISSALALAISIGSIANKSARQYAGRQQHQIWGLISLCAIFLNVLLGLLWVYTKYNVQILHRVNGTLAYILVLATSSIALIHFMDWSASAVISIATVLAVLVVYAVAIKLKYKEEKNTPTQIINYDDIVATDFEGRVLTFDKRLRRSTRKSNPLYF